MSSGHVMCGDFPLPNPVAFSSPYRDGFAYSCVVLKSYVPKSKFPCKCPASPITVPALTGSMIFLEHISFGPSLNTSHGASSSAFCSSVLIPLTWLKYP